MGVTGLAPGQDVELMLFLPNGAPAYDEPLLMTADATGSIPPGPIIYDLIAAPDGTVKPLVELLGDYTLRIVGQGVDQTLTFTIGSREGGRAIPDGALIVILNKDNLVAQGSILNGTEVIVKGIAFTPGHQVRLFVVADKPAWNVGDSLDDVTGEAAVETATADANGEFSVTVWANAAPVSGLRDFDVVAHEGEGDTLASGDLVEGYWIIGFTVQDAPTGGDLLAQLAAKQGQWAVYEDQFDVGDTIVAGINPSYQPTLPHEWVMKYVVAHKAPAEWVAGAKLVDVTGRPEVEMVRKSCTNDFWTSIWSNAQPGKYDVVFDINEDGLYTPGTDILDDGRAGSTAGCGFQVGTTFAPKVVVAGDPPVIDAGAPSDISAQVLDQTWAAVGATTVTFSVVSGPGSLSAATAQTGADGIATVQLTGTTPGSQTTVRGTATIAGSDVTGETTIRTRTSGGLNVIVRSRRGR
jgi:hypothetical protein